MHQGGRTKTLPWCTELYYSTDLSQSVFSHNFCKQHFSSRGFMKIC